MPRITVSPCLRRTALAATLTTGLALGGGIATAAGDVESDADSLVRQMSDYMSALSAFSVRGDVDDEVIDLEGQKLQFSSSATLVVERPGRIYAHRQGPVADLEVFFDGRSLTLHGKRLDVYMQRPIEGTVDDAINELRLETDLGVPAGDLLYTDSYDGLMQDVISGRYLGAAYVHGTEVHHLAFRAPKVDWQLWIQTGEQPLPMKYVITSKWITGAPEYTVRFRDWNTAPEIDPGQFEFTPSENAVRVEFMPIEDLGTVGIKEAR